MTPPNCISAVSAGSARRILGLRHSEARRAVGIYSDIGESTAVSFNIVNSGYLMLIGTVLLC